MAQQLTDIAQGNITNMEPNFEASMSGVDISTLDTLHARILGDKSKTATDVCGKSGPVCTK